MKRIISPRQQQSKCKSEKGFTLLETAVAAMVMTVGIISVMQLFTLSALYNKSAKQTTLASTIAKRKMEQLLSMANPATEVAPLGYGGALGSANAVTGYSENYYVDYDRNGTKGTMQVRNTAWYDGQDASYIVTWKVEQDIPTDPLTGVTQMTGLRRITVRAEATQAALIGNGAGSSTKKPQAESATLSTIRTPFQ